MFRGFFFVLVFLNVWTITQAASQIIDHGCELVGMIFAGPGFPYPTISMKSGEEHSFPSIGVYGLKNNAFPFGSYFGPSIRTEIGRHLTEAQGARLDANTRARLQERFNRGFSEILMNAMKSANHFDPAKKVNVRFTITANELTVEISDRSGRFFNPHDPESPERKNEVFLYDPKSKLGPDEIADNRKKVNHDASRPDGDGGLGFNIATDATDSLEYMANTEEGKIVGTRVRAKWSF